MKMFNGATRKRGIGLMESIVYLACSVLFISLAGQLLFTIQRSVQGEAQKAEGWVQLAVAMESVCRLFKDASREKVFWKVMKSDCAIFRARGGDRGILVEKGRLVSVRGTYSLNGYWMNRSQSVLLENAALHLHYEMHAGKIMGISVLIRAAHNTQLETFIGLS